MRRIRFLGSNADEKKMAIFTWAGFIVLIVGCSAAGSQPGSVAVSPAAPSLAATPTPADVAAPMLTGTSPCPDPMGIIKAFYDSNDASQYDASLELLTADATFSSWAEGVNGRHWQEKHLTGKEQIRTVLSKRGLRRTSDQPDTPIFHETEARIIGDQVTFMLRADRLSPDGRLYNPYKVETVFLGCKIKSLTVIEFISWE
jgi:hypothetical protein